MSDNNEESYGNVDKEYRLVYYKSMRDEYIQLFLYNQKLWNYKLSTLGAVIAISVFNDKLLGAETVESLAGVNPVVIVSLGIMVLPLLSFLIDLKIVEMGMQMKLISNHIAKTMADVSVIADWEKTLWHDTPIASTRTMLSLILYVGASTVILILSFVTIALLIPEWQFYLIVIGTVLLVLPLIAMFTLIPKLLK